MAKALIACFRKKEPTNLYSFSNALCKRITPENVTAKPPYIYLSQKAVTVIYNESPNIQKNGHSLCLGVCDRQQGVFEINSQLPNGSYALFRVGEKRVEVATDYASSRTIWYYSDDELFMASTSQRMMIALLGDFQLNHKACGWFLSSGTLGPGLSWDKRIQMVPPRTQIGFDRVGWELSFDSNTDFSFETSDSLLENHAEYKRHLKKAVKSSIQDLSINVSQWTLALSGGMDSRSLLFHLKEKNLNTVTWGHSSALAMISSDARIAKKLADICQIKNSYAKMDFQKGSFPKIIDRFLASGEGRLDHLAAYLDGLGLWENLSASGRGVIRGYDAFGRKPPVKNSYQVYRTCNLNLSDRNNSIIPNEYRISENDIPKNLRRNTSESLEDWRDRLWLQHRTPVTTAALEDIKLGYVEVINPLLNKKIVSIVQSLPKALRNNKTVWHSIVSEMFPEVPFAKREAVQEVGKILSLPEVKDYIRENLLSRKNASIFPESFILQLVNNYDKNKQKHDLRRRFRRFVLAYLPRKVENIIRANISSGVLSHKWMALRVVMISKSIEMFVEDSHIFDSIDK